MEELESILNEINKKLLLLSDIQRTVDRISEDLYEVVERYLETLRR